jgi:hypothetical protein
LFGSPTKLLAITLLHLTFIIVDGGFFDMNEAGALSPFIYKFLLVVKVYNLKTGFSQVSISIP